jgi:hypothetical protein
MPVSLKRLSLQLPADDIRDLAAEMMSRKMGKVDIVDEIVAFVDGFIDWRDIVKGPAGAAMEAGDGPLLRLCIRVIVGSVGRRSAE